MSETETLRSLLARCELEKLNPLASWPTHFRRASGDSTTYTAAELLMKLSNEELNQEVFLYTDKIYPAGTLLDDKSFIWWATTDHIGDE
jgi:hypothetical protein